MILAYFDRYYDVIRCKSTYLKEYDETHGVSSSGVEPYLPAKLNAEAGRRAAMAPYVDAGPCPTACRAGCTFKLSLFGSRDTSPIFF